MLINPTKLSLIVTHKCTAACDHCCFHCTPKIQTRIPEKRLEEIIDEAVRDLPSLKTVVFTGGECFLLPELDDRIAQVTRLGKTSRCVTNGYWAFNETRAHERVAKLKEAGLTEINFSTGRFHGEYVPPERIAYGARACYDAGILPLINVEICDQEDETDAFLRSHPLLAESVKEGKILYQRNVWIENQGDVDLTHSEDVYRFNEGKMTGCQTAMDVVAVTPTMSLVACCGLHLEKIPELHIGSIAERSIGEAIKTAQDDFMKIWLRVSGPERIYSFAKSKEPTIELPVTASHPCESCLKLFKDEKAMQVLTEHYPEVEQEVVSMFMADLVVNSLDARVKEQHERIEEPQVA